MDTVQWLLVGPGDIASSRVAPALCAARHSRLAAICGRCGSPKTAALAARHGVGVVFDDYEHALSESGADAVYIATPHRMHVRMCLMALEAGKHVFCEKPLGLSAAECLPLAAAVGKSGLKAACSNYRLFTNQFRTTGRLIREGTIGELLGGWAHDEEPYYNPAGEPLLTARGMAPEHGYGFYLINLAQHLFGMPSEVFAVMSSFNCAGNPDYDINDLENIILKFPGGQQFSIILNMTARACLRHAYSFYGSAGRIYWPECPPHFNSPIQLVKGGVSVLADSVSGVRAGVIPNWHLPMVQDFVDALREDRDPRCTIESAVATALITEAAIRSASSGRLEKVAPLRQENLS